MPAKDRNQWYELSGDNLCVFHRKANKHTLRCEGFAESLIKQSWGNPADKKAWQKKHCTKGGKKCPIYRIIMWEKYTDSKAKEDAIKILEALPTEFPDDFIENAVELILALMRGEEE